MECGSVGRTLGRLHPFLVGEDFDHVCKISVACVVIFALWVQC